MAIDVKVPGVGESVQEGMIASWSKKNGDAIQQDDVLCELETDKATVEIVAENAGTLTILVEAGKVVKVGEVIARIEAGAQASAGKGEEPKAAVTSQAAPAPTSKVENAKENSASQDKEHGPAVRRMLSETNIDPSSVTATGKGGRLTKGDLLEAMEKKSSTKTSEVPKKDDKKLSQSVPTIVPGSRGETREPMSMLRRKIAKRLVESQHTAAILTTFNEVDMSAVMNLRNKYKDVFEKRYGLKLGFMGFFLKASVWALNEFPRVNASIENDEIVYHHYSDIGVAVSTEKGLLVPVIRNVEQMSVKDIEQAINDMAVKARANKISLDDLSGGTFTVSNGGIFGSLLSTPIINPPQTAILGMHKIQQRPMVLEDGRIEARPMMYLAMSYDHRLIDGKEAVQFLVKVKEIIEDPSRLLLGV